MSFVRFLCSGSRVGCELSRCVQAVRLPLQWLAISSVYYEMTAPQASIGHLL